MNVWKNKKIGLVELNGNSIMIDTEGIEVNGGIYQISCMVFDKNGNKITQKSWYIQEKIELQIKKHREKNHNENQGVFKKLLKIQNQKNAQRTGESVAKSIKKLCEKYQIQNVLGQSIYYYDLPLIKEALHLEHASNIFGKNINYFDIRVHYQKAVDHNEKYKDYQITKGRYKVDTLSRYFLNKKEKHTATNDCVRQLELLKLLEVA